MHDRRDVEGVIGQQVAEIADRIRRGEYISDFEVHPCPARPLRAAIEDEGIEDRNPGLEEENRDPEERLTMEIAKHCWRFLHDTRPHHPFFVEQRREVEELSTELEESLSRFLSVFTRVQFNNYIFNILCQRHPDHHAMGRLLALDAELRLLQATLDKSKSELCSGERFGLPGLPDLRVRTGPASKPYQEQLVRELARVIRRQIHSTADEVGSVIVEILREIVDVELSKKRVLNIIATSQ